LKPIAAHHTHYAGFALPSKTSDHDLFAAVIQPRPDGSARTKRSRRLRRVANRAAEAQRTADDAELQAAGRTIDELRRQLADAIIRADRAEADARQARRDNEADRAVTVSIRKDERASTAAFIDTACAKAVKGECDVLTNRVSALQEQLAAERALREAEQAKYQADETLHLLNASRLRQERDILRGQRDALRRRLDKLQPRLVFPGTQSNQ